jgi:hypothetical protein
MTLEKRADLILCSSLHDYRRVGATDHCIQTALKPWRPALLDICCSRGRYFFGISGEIRVIRKSLRHGFYNRTVMTLRSSSCYFWLVFIKYQVQISSWMSKAVPNNFRGFSKSFPATNDIVRSVGQRQIPYPLEIIIPRDIIWRHIKRSKWKRRKTKTNEHHKHVNFITVGYALWRNL